MDPFEAQNITFLDLSGVDDQERAAVLNSLCEENANVQLPWNVPEHKVVHKNDVKPHNVHVNNRQGNHKVVLQPHRSYILSQGDYNAPLYPTTIAYPIPPQYVDYSPYQYPANPVVSTNIASATLANNVVYTHNPPVLLGTVGYADDGVQYANNAGSLEQTNAAPKTVAVASEDPLPGAAVVRKEPTPEKGNDVRAAAENHIQQNGVVQRSEPEPVQEKPKHSTPANKSWASLFSSAKASDGGSGENGNVDEKSLLNEAVNQQNDEVDDPIRNPKKSQFIDPHCYRMGEYLLSHTVDGRTISLQPRGLINKSNYCYINSILQALLACPPVYNLLKGLSEQNTSAEKQKPTPIIDGMCEFIKKFQHLPAGLRVNRRNDKNQKKDQGVQIDYDSPVEPLGIYRMLNGIRSDSFLVEGRQEDAEEFLGCLLNGLNDEMLELMKLVKTDLAVSKFSSKGADQDSEKEWQVMGPKNKGGVTRQVEFVKTPISNIFGGFLKSRIHRAGDHSTYHIQPFFTLQLNIEKVKTVREALESLVSKNQLEGVTSEKTNEEVEAWQQVTLEELPVILILHLKCFDFKLDGCTKIMKALEFPIDLKIDSKLLSSKPNTPKEKQYKLFAVVYHDGKEATKGHYITDAFHVGYSSWIRYDDASVKSVQEDYVLKPQGTRVPYLLFYRRSDTISRSK